MQQESVYKTISNLEKEKKLLMENKSISERNKEIITNFIQYKKFKGLSEARLLKYYNRLRQISLKLSRDFDKAGKKDIEGLVIQINESNLSNGTKADDLGILKVFYKWLLGKDKKYPRLVEDISIKRETKRRAPAEILVEEDILKMIEATSSARDKSMISVLADSGIRVGELVNLKLKNVSYSDDGLIQLMVETGKTGGRRVLLIPSVPYISNWLNYHPQKDSQDAWLFPSLDHKNYLGQMTHASINVRLHKIAKKCGVSKAVNPHAFRRSSATNSSNFMTDTQLMIRYGWSKRQTVSSYTFLNPKEADDSYRKGYGRKEVEIKESKLQPKICICKTANAPTNDFCSNCGKPPNSKTLGNRRKCNLCEKCSLWN